MAGEGVGQAVEQAGSAGRWSAPGQTCRVAGRTLPGGMLYVGTDLAAASGHDVEPALIDPRLPVDLGSPDWTGRDLGYWPSYSQIAPGCRAAYLRWLEAGRRHRDVSVGYAFLFLYGLERRVLVDLRQDETARAAELPLIQAEVERLLELFGSDASFQGYATGFRRLIEAVSVAAADGAACAGPAPEADRRRPSARLRVGLGEFARGRRPVPAEWALAWVTSHPAHSPRTAAKRCPGEFAELFAVRYDDRHLGGFHIKPAGPPPAFAYRPASGGFRGPVTLEVPGVPDVFDQALPLRRLASLADECAESLDAYSRVIGRDPGLRGTLAAAALLPEELLDLGSGDAGAFTEWARSRLGGFAMSAVPAADLLRWSGADEPAKKDVIALARLLGHAGIGLEPDPRFGGPVPKGGSVVFFHVDDAVDAAPSHAYRAASLLLHLGAAVSLADGHVAVEEKELLIGHLEEALDLTRAERTRLRAHLRWLLATEVKLTGLARRIETVEERQREHLAGFLSAVAAADGRIDPAEVKTLRRIAKLLGLAPEVMDEHLRAAASEMNGAPAVPPPASDPVVVRPGRPERGHAVPPPAAEPAAAGPGVHRGHGLGLDESLLAARIAEAAEVSALLGSVFGDDDPAPAPSPPPPGVAPVAGLDGGHSRLIRALPAHPTLPRASWEELAAAHRVLPDGAIDRLNEAAYETTGEPVIEGDDPLEINREALEAML
ncbi:TerB N-terminal domain-containing protein [Actinomadura sp. 3N508]